MGHSPARKSWRSFETWYQRLILLNHQLKDGALTYSDLGDGLARLEVFRGDPFEAHCALLASIRHAVLKRGGSKSTSAGANEGSPRGASGRLLLPESGIFTDMLTSFPR